MSAVDPQEPATVLEVLRLAARSTDAATLAANAIRAARARSPVLSHRVAKAVSTALADRAVEWTDEERAQMAEALLASDRAPLNEGDHAARSALSAWIARSGLSFREWAVLLGCNVRTLRRWLSGQNSITGSVEFQVGALVGVEVSETEVILRFSRAALRPPGGPVDE